MTDKLTTYLQNIMPQHALSKFAGWVAEIRLPWVKNFIIERFIKRYHVDMTDAVIENPRAYINFNAFFTRTLKPQSRPIVQDVNTIISPVDGSISQIGSIEKDKLLQAKGFDFNLTALLGGDTQLAQQFENGAFATLYLAPRDYHRIHMPIDGQLIKTIYVPGKLFSVNAINAETVPNLYSRNERLICLFDTKVGRVAVILVGAFIVGSIQTVWQTKPARSKQIEVYTPTVPVMLKKGDEIGYFKLGSTVIILFEKERMQWLPSQRATTSVKMGNALGVS